MNARPQSILPTLICAFGLSLALGAAIWAFWPQSITQSNVVVHSRPQQPTLTQALRVDSNAAAQFWLEDLADSYAKQLAAATGDHRLELEAMLNRTLAELAMLQTHTPQKVGAPSTIIRDHPISPQQSWD
ncbi:MAG: hypothetical protein ACOVVK_05105 [Elsteraceae bacterium]